jgi:hypothetical protein
MDAREYRRELSKPLRAAIVFGVLAAIVWAVAFSLSVFWEVDVGWLTLVLGVLMVAVVISAGLELLRHRSRWLRGFGGLMIAGASLAVVFVLLLIWYVSALCGSGGCS